MIMANDKQNTSPNVPNKGNVPRLRFPEFTEEWNFKTLDTLAPNISAGKDYANEGNYKLYGSTGVIGTTDKPSYKGEILLVARVGANAGYLQYVNGEFGVTDNTLVVNAHDNNRYIYYYLQHYNLNRLVFGSGQPLITGGMLKKVPIGISNDCAEKNKIVKLLSLLDARIATQNKIIEQLQSLIKGIRVRLFSFDNYDIKYLGDLCSITTGKLDANAMVENGKYPFFTCAEDTFRIDEYAFDTEALLISGNGANLGYIHYYKGKFNAYQRTYVLDKFSVEVMYLKYYLETFLNQRINQEVNVGNTPYIVLSTLTKMKIKIPDISQQRNIINVLSNLNLKLNQEKDILSAYQTQKAYLLRNLFI